MGRSLPPATQLVLQQIDEVRPIYEALRRSDQLILDAIFDEIQAHRAAIANAANLLPLEVMLVLSQLEQRKRFNRLYDELCNELEELQLEVRGTKPLP